jgi:hypothetical protein
MNASSFLELASPAPDVEEATASKQSFSEEVQVEAAEESGNALVEPAPKTDPAVPFDDPTKFGPKLLPGEMSSLSVAHLRGYGTEFEAEAVCIKGGVEKNALRRLLPFIYDERDFLSYGEVLRFILVKGNVIFVFGRETDPSPLYAIDIASVRGIVEDPKKPDPHSYTISPQIGTNKAGTHLTTVLLKDRLTGKQAYQITFDTSRDMSLVKRFMNALETSTKHYGGQLVTAAVVEATDEGGKPCAKDSMGATHATL